MICLDSCFGSISVFFSPFFLWWGRLGESMWACGCLAVKIDAFATSAYEKASYLGTYNIK